MNRDSTYPVYSDQRSLLGRVAELPSLAALCSVRFSSAKDSTKHLHTRESLFERLVPHWWPKDLHPLEMHGRLFSQFLIEHLAVCFMSKITIARKMFFRLVSLFLHVLSLEWLFFSKSLLSGSIMASYWFQYVQNGKILVRFVYSKILNSELQQPFSMVQNYLLWEKIGGDSLSVRSSHTTFEG